MSWRDQVRNAALNSCPAILYELLPGGQARGAQYATSGLTGGQGNSLKVNLRSGRWGEWAASPPITGGDIISLYAKVKGMPYGQAERELSERFGIPQPERQKAERWKPIVPMPRDADFKNYPDMQGELGGEWVYRDAEGAPLMVRVRRNYPDGRKAVFPLTWCANEQNFQQWRVRDLNPPRPLYGLDRLALRASLPGLKILIVEGEKSCDAAQRLLPDWCVVTWPGGVNRCSSRDTDWSPVASLKTRVVVWPDNDEPGRRAALQIAAQMPGEVWVLEPDRFKKKGWDAADAETEGWTTEQAENWIKQNQRPPTAAAEREAVDLSERDPGPELNALYKAIGRANDPATLFCSAGRVVRVFRDSAGRAVTYSVGVSALREWLASRVAFSKNHQKSQVSCYPSPALLESALDGLPERLPVLEVWSDVPLISGSGKVYDRPGYAPEIRCYIDCPVSLEEMDLDSAIALLEEWLVDFPFESDSDFHNLLTLPLTVILRPAISGPAPLWRIEAPTARTGKTLLSDCIAEVVAPSCAAMSECHDRKEWRQSLFTSLLNIPAVLRMDNVTDLDSSALKMAISSATGVKQRVLGGNVEATVPVRCAWVLTANNPILDRELLARSVRARLNSKSEHPEWRSDFLHPDALEYARENRVTLLSALLTVAKVGFAVETEYEGPKIGGFAAWSSVLGRVAHKAGWTEFLGTMESDEEQAGDSKAEAANRFLLAWFEAHGNSPVRPKDLIEHADGAVRPGKDGRITAENVGYWLKRNRGSVHAGLEVTSNGRDRSGTLWSLTGRPEGEKEAQLW